MHDPRINLRSRGLAAVLAFLVPGAGHLYQGRRVKAIIYAACILGTYFCGMILGEWQPVYSQVASAYYEHENTQLMENQPRTRLSYGYAAQALVGLPSLPAIIQQERFRSNNGPQNSLTEPLNSEFQGILRTRDANGESVATAVSGTISLEPAELGSVVGRLEGTTPDDQKVSLDIRGSIVLGRQVFGSPRRDIVCRILDGDNAAHSAELQGAVQRSFTDWYQAPRDNHELDRLHGKLSQKFDVALVFTWIAGLLNLMAIWDAYDGPAYAYGDEKPEEDEDSGSDKDKVAAA